MGETALLVSGIAAFVVLLVVFLYFAGVFTPPKITVEIPLEFTIPSSTGHVLINDNAPEGQQMQKNTIYSTLPVPGSVHITANGTFHSLQFASQQIGTDPIHISGLSLAHGTNPMTLLMDDLAIAEPTFSSPTTFSVRTLTLDMINRSRAASNGRLIDGDDLSVGFLSKDASAAMIMGTNTSSYGVQMRVAYIQ
jgi:hypothetical protein